jgi:hypothetical protein
MSEKKDKTTRDQALRVARMLGCQGAHETGAGWMPCSSHEEYEGIKKGKEEYLKVRASNNKKPLPKMVQRTKRLETKSGAYYENRADAVSISKINGCNGVRTVMLGGKRYYVPCQPKGWEKLDESPITGIATLPGGGLVTGSFSGKSDEEEMDEKGFVNFVSRSTDPDTFSDPESARIRARNLGCIGIRRYTARDGKLVWLPCTNVSDYNRVTGIRGDNSPINNPRRQGSGFKKKSEMEEKALGRSISGYRRMFKPIGGMGALEDGDGDGFATGADGEDNIPVAKVPKPKANKPKKQRLSFAEHQAEMVRRRRQNAPKSPSREANAPRSVTRIDYDKAKDVKDYWKSSIDEIVKTSGLSKDDKEYAKKMRRIQKFAYLRASRKYKLSPKEVQQHINEVGRAENLPYVVTPEELNVRDVMLARGAKRSQKDALDDGIFFYKGVPKPKKKPPTVTSTDINNLAVMVRKNNAKAKTSAKTNLRDLKVVFVRGLADGGREEANKRVSKFLSLLNSDKPKDVKYSEDNDLLPIDHPWKNRKTAKKWADFEEGEYGVKYAGGCCPKVVKRYRSK